MKGCPNLVWALYRPDLAPAERNILVHMANVANPALLCADSMAQIGRLFNMSVRSVMRCISELESKNYIERRRRFRSPNVYLVKVPQTEEGKRDRGPSSYSAKSGSFTQPADGDKSGITQPLDGDKTCMSTAPNSAKSGQNAPSYSAKLAQEESSLKKESPKKAQEAASLSGEGSQQAADKVTEPEPPVVRTLEGLPPGIAAIALRNGWGVGQADAPAARPEPVVAVAPEPVAAQPEPIAVDAAEASPAADMRPAAEIAASVVRALSRKEYAPGPFKQLSADEQIDRLTPLRPAVKPCHLTPEQLAMARAGYGARAVVRQREYA